MRSTTFSRYGLVAAAAVVLVAALFLWSARRWRAQQQQLERERHVSVLLKRTHDADVTLSYSALVAATAMYGGHTMKSTARLVRAPRKLAITYLSGDKKGMQSGYNERWFWRRERANAPMEAYASVEYRPDEMTSRRFKLMKKNYRGRLLGAEPVDGRPAEVVELQPRHRIEGASGPFKRLWIDRQSGLTLRVDSFNCKSQPVMNTVLSQVRIVPHLPDEHFVPPDDMFAIARKETWMAEELGAHFQKVAQKTGIQPPQPSYKPPGFEFDSYGVHNCDQPGQPDLAALTRYSDGINVLTIFALKPVAGTSAASATKADATRADATKPDAAKRQVGQATSKLANVEVMKGSWQSQACDFGPGTMMVRDTTSGRLLAVADLPPEILSRVLESTHVRLAAAR